MFLVSDRMLLYPPFVNSSNSQTTTYYYSLLNFALLCLVRDCQHLVLPNFIINFLNNESYGNSQKRQVNNLSVSFFFY